ncbi:hypothetical protein U0070_016944, partial [Myodes glareolus]
SPFPHSPFHSPKPISLTHPPPHASPPLQLRRRHVPSPARTSFAGNPGDVTTRSALLPALSRKDAKVVTCPERQRGCAQGGFRDALHFHFRAFKQLVSTIPVLDKAPSDFQGHLDTETVLGRTRAPALLFLCLVELCAGHSILKASYDMRSNESNQSPLKDDCLPTTCMLPPDGFHPRKGNLPCLFSEEATTGFLTALFLALLVTAQRQAKKWMHLGAASALGTLALCDFRVWQEQKKRRSDKLLELIFCMK